MTLKEADERCERCGETKVLERVGGGMLEPKCPNKDCLPEWISNPQPRPKKTHLCRGCWQQKTDCVAHHVSYQPEKVTPMCLDCHAKLHERDEFLPHLTPDMGRDEAERKGLVSVVGLEDWQPHS